MTLSKRRIAFSSVLALLIYLLPNLVQDIHRVSGNHEIYKDYSAIPGEQLHLVSDKCAVCVFEFNVVSGIENFVYVSLQQTQRFLLNTKQEHQVSEAVFYYYQLMEPPRV